MGARPSSFKKGGGFLNNVQGTIEGLTFSDVFPGGNGKPSASGFNSLYAILDAQVDGSEKPVQTTMFAGNADDFEIEDDGKTLVPIGSANLSSNSDFGKFLASLCENGFPETSLPDEDEPITYEAIVGTRVTFVQNTDEVSMAKQAKKWRSSGGKYNEQGQKKGKDGKFYNLQYLTVSEVIALPGASTGKATKAGKATAAPAGKAGKGKAKEVSIEDVAKEALLAVLADNDGKLAKAKLPVKIQQQLGKDHPQREEVRKLVYTDEFLETEDGWTYNKKKQVIEAVEEDAE